MFKEKVNAQTDARMQGRTHNGHRTMTQPRWPLARGAKNDPPIGSHVLQAKVTIFKLIQEIIGTNLLTKFHEV